MAKRKYIALQPSQHSLLSKYAKERGKRLTKAVVDAVEKAEKYESIVERFNGEAFDKALWYSIKLAFSIQALKELCEDNVDGELREAQLKRLKDIVRKVRYRLKVKLEDIYEIAEQYAREPSRQNKILLNEALKLACAEIFKQTLLE
ncbi:MAG: hypothetical protein ACXQTI_02690 [Candidatus Nezhaarchaeales archaeon]